MYLVIAFERSPSKVKLNYWRELEREQPAGLVFTKTSPGRCDMTSNFTCKTPTIFKKNHYLHIIIRSRRLLLPCSCLSRLYPPSPWEQIFWGHRIGSLFEKRLKSCCSARTKQKQWTSERFWTFNSVFLGSPLTGGERQCVTVGSQVGPRPGGFNIPLGLLFLK